MPFSLPTYRKMNGYVSLFFSCPLMFFSLFSLGFSQLSDTQNATIINISKLLNPTPNSLSWNVTKHPNPCLWKGITCQNSSITNLSLSGFGLSTSDFLPEICRIESLQFLDLSNNQLTSIPDEFINSCRHVDGLKLLNFSKNRLVGPLPTFRDFEGLQVLDLSFNSLSGSISSQLDGLISLKSLNLSFNKFDGPVPNLGKSRVLEELKLSVNLFQGIIPPELVNYQSLKLIDFSVNKLFGPIPSEISNLTQLRFLILSVNNLSGKIPIGISNISTLYRFAAHQNKFSGRIPSGITTSLSILDLSYNNLTGSIPPDFLDHPNLRTLDLSYNSLDGSLPVNISSNLLRLRLGSNSITGAIPSSFTTHSNLIYLELDNNSLTSIIPAELGACRSLALLNLAQNKLTGTLPPTLGNLSNLEVLKLQINNLVGNIPTEITKLLKLSTLNVSYNLLTGSIPSSISRLQHLAYLHLQSNNLNGFIPETIRNMNSLLELQLGENQLSGRIPLMPQKLQIALNLSSNLFQGSIPSGLSQLSDLEILDLSNNSFSGEIPEFLTQLGSLIQLNLSNNRLSGHIPEFKRWVSVSASGNAGLINDTKAKNSPPENTKKMKSVSVAIILAVVIAVVGVGVITTIVISLSRRFLKVNDQKSQTEENLAASQVIRSNVLTSHEIHKSNIDLMKAMEAVTDPCNTELKTRFCTYYKATMPSGASYFVKKIDWNINTLPFETQNKFGHELELLGKLSHSNVMSCLAYVLTADNAYILYEYAQRGTLFDALHGKLGSLDWASRYSVAVGVAQGLTFLHECTCGPILLLDLSSRNIFLKSLKEPVVGDIELCKVIDPTKSTGNLSTVAGSIGYIPPEYAYTMRLTTAGNVYSFGVVLLELLTGKPAVGEGTELLKWISSMSEQQGKWDHILDFSISRSSLATRGHMLEILKIALSCVNVSPEARPKMRTVLRMILNAR